MKNDRSVKDAWSAMEARLATLPDLGSVLREIDESSPGEVEAGGLESRIRLPYSGARPKLDPPWRQSRRRHETETSPCNPRRNL